MKNKTVSLCDESFAVAQKMPNFSGWLRHQLLKYQPKQKVEVKVKTHVPKNSMCKNCMAIGDHWTMDCPKLDVVE